jgi:hypothetical protein
MPSLFAQQVQTVNGILQLPPPDAGVGAGQRSAAGGQTTAVIDTTLPYSYVLLSFKTPLSEEEQQVMAQTGLRLLSWVPDNAYIVRVSAPRKLHADLAMLSAQRNIQAVGIGKVPLELKVETTLFPYVSKGSPLPDNLSDNGLEIQLYDAADMPIVRALLNKLHVRLHQDKTVSTNSIIIQATSGAILRKIALLPYVATVSIHAGEPQPEWNTKMQVNGIYPVNYDLGGPVGANTYLGNFETYGNYPRFELDYKNRRNTTYNSNEVNEHGSNIAYITGAANNYDEQYRGMAPGVTVVKLSWLSGIDNIYNSGIKPLVSNYSVGWGVGNLTYDNSARELDRMARDLGAYIHCFSSGNDGGANNTTLGYGAGWANITGRVKSNKNNMTVHSTEYPGVQLDWTSKGPVADGRLKPDICAHGPEGTSYASPGVAGLIAVLYEAYNTSYNTTITRGDVVKAAILNTANDIDKKGIDYKTGFGEINPSRALQAIKDQRIITGTASITTPAVYTLTVPAGINEARFMLYWHDYPGTVGAAKALVNDLDLQVVTPAGDTLLPWVLDHTVGKHYDLPLRKRDTLNNVEQVTIDNPVSGSYKVIVKGTLIPQGPQPFVVTYDWLPISIKIINPAPGFRVAPAGTILFTWNLFNQQATTADSVEVYLQPSSTTPVQLLASLPYNRLYYSYTIPGGFAASSTARIIVKQRNTSLADTSAFFHVMPAPKNVAFVTSCANAVTLRWDTLGGGVSRYIIYRLGDKYMTAIDSIAHPQTQKQISGTWSANEWFAVAARHTNGALSLRSLPVTQSQTHPLAPDYLRLNKSYTLCTGDTVRLHTGYFSGDSIRWFRSGQLLTGATGNAWTVGRAAPGDYQFRVYTGSCTYESDTFKIGASTINITDTAAWGTNGWKAYTFAQADFSKYYGNFTIADSISINSDLYYPWAQWPQNAAGYNGCNLTTKPFYVIYKRSGFPAGTYRMNLFRADRQMRLWVNGVLVYTSPLNAFTINGVWTGTLDANSTVRVEHYTTGGSHVNFQLEQTSSARIAAVASTTENDGPAIFSLSPNPATENCYIRTVAPLKADAWATITNINGVVVQQMKFAQGAQMLQIDLSSMTSGIYLIKLKQKGQKLQVLKFVKQ